MVEESNETTPIGLVSPRVTGLIAHEWVAQAGGSENVVEQFLAAFPGADLQVLWSDDPNRFAARTYETWLARTPLRRYKAMSLPFMPQTWRSVKAQGDYEWILASSHLFAHHVRPRGLRALVPKYSYVHTPARYIWEPELDPRGASRMVRAAGKFFKPLDKKRAHESDKMAANSRFTRERIRRVWGRDADVIYPPVDTERIISGGDWRNHLTGAELSELESLPSEFVLGASRFVSYKRLDLVIKVGEALGVPVVLAGAGSGYEALRAKASDVKVPVAFVVGPSDAMLYALYQRASVFMFPTIEDFGIMPVEAMAAGTAVAVAPVGGAAESARLLDGGSVAESFELRDWKVAIDAAERLVTTGLAERAKWLSNDSFRSAVQAWLSPGGMSHRDFDAREGQP